MNTNALRSIRIGQGKDTAHMAKVIGKSNDSYAKKERGDVKFTPSEIELVVNDLDLSPVQMSTIFLTQNYRSVRTAAAAFQICNYCNTKEGIWEWQRTV